MKKDEPPLIRTLTALQCYDREVKHDVNGKRQR